MSAERNKGGRPQSERIAQAMALVAQGMTQYKAYRQAQCSASGLYKAIKRAKANAGIAVAQSQPREVV